MAALELSNIAHQYFPQVDALYALNNISEVWQDGGAYALLGPSGCGKTTLLNIISGLLRPSEGRVLFDSIDVTDLSPEQRNIAQIFQFPVVYDTLSVAENLAFPLKNRGLPKAQIDSRVREVLAMLGLTERAQRKASSLSADDKQKISLGRGLVRMDVKAILFDEPLTVIDPHLKWQLRTELKKIHRQFQHTMIYVTHDQTEALTFADKVVVLFDGRVVQMGTPQQLFEQPEHTFVGYFIGSPGMNVLEAKVSGDKAVVAGTEISLGKGFGTPTGKVELGVRPEFTSLSSGDEGLPVTIRRVEDVGRHKIVRADFLGTEINILAPESANISPDMNRVVFDMAGINVYSDSWRVAPKAA